MMVPLDFAFILALLGPKKPLMCQTTLVHMANVFVRLAWLVTAGAGRIAALRQKRLMLVWQPKEVKWVAKPTQKVEASKN